MQINDYIQVLYSYTNDNPMDLKGNIIGLPTMMTSCADKFCRHLQNCGLHVDKMCRHRITALSKYARLYCLLETAKCSRNDVTAREDFPNTATSPLMQKIVPSCESKQGTLAGHTSSICAINTGNNISKLPNLPI